MNAEDFIPGQEVKIEIKTHDAKGDFDTKVALIHKNMLLLEPIVMDGKLVGFPPECSVSLFVIVHNTCYAWNDINIQTVSFKGHYYNAVELNSPAATQNRRNNYRVSIGEAMTVVYFTEAGPKPIHAYVRDISESGFAFLVNSTFDVGRMVRLTIPTSDKTNINLTAKIVRTQPTQRQNEYIYGCRFTERSNKLSNWIMQLQRNKQSKKNGLIHSGRKI